MNVLALTGRLTSSPELKTTASGISFTNITIAVDREYKDNKGERLTDFFDVTVWRQTAEYLTQYGNKGDLISVQGGIQKRSYDKDGKTIWVVDVVADKVSILQRNEPKQEATYEAPKAFVKDDDLPF